MRLLMVLQETIKDKSTLSVALSSQDKQSSQLVDVYF